MPWPKTSSIIYHIQLGFRDKDCAIKGLVVYNRTCYGTYYEGLTLRCFQPSPEVLINAIVWKVPYYKSMLKSVLLLYHSLYYIILCNALYKREKAIQKIINFRKVLFYAMYLLKQVFFQAKKLSLTPLKQEIRHQFNLSLFKLIW